MLAESATSGKNSFCKAGLFSRPSGGDQGSMLLLGSTHIVFCLIHHAIASICSFSSLLLISALLGSVTGLQGENHPAKRITSALWEYQNVCNHTVEGLCKPHRIYQMEKEKLPIPDVAVELSLYELACRGDGGLLNLCSTSEPMRWLQRG